jgi:AmmeMemoRadiSam system protein A
MLQKKNAALVALSNLEDITLTAIEFYDLEVFLQTIPLIQDHTQSKKIASYPSIVAAIQFAQDTNCNTVTVLKNYSTKHSTANQIRHQASIMLYDYCPPNLIQVQQELLIELARTSIQSYIEKREIPNYITDDPALKRKSGVFVTLRQKKSLRGCIGRLQLDTPLFRAVQEMAIAAATSDPRFPPITQEEIEDLSFKIAILSPLKRITNDEVEVGKHGLLIAHQGRRGVLLPQVPVERGWKRETFLTNLCLKAGLKPSTWRKNPTLYAFTALEFGHE